MFAFAKITDPSPSFENYAYINGDLIIKDTGILRIKPNAIDSEKIRWHAIQAEDLDTSSITSRIIKDGTIQGQDISANADLTIESLTVSGEVVINGTSTITGNMDMADNVISNIGNSGTDFTATGGLTLADNLILGANTLTTTNTTLVSNLNADYLDGQHGAYYLNTGTNFSGDISGAYNTIAVADDSHNHTATTLPATTSYLGQTIESIEITDGTVASVDLSNSIALLADGTFSYGLGTLTANALNTALTYGISISGNAANVTGTVAIANGGTGQTSVQTARNALLPTQTANAGKFLQTDGTDTTWQNILWSNLNAPTANLALAMQSYTTTFTYGATTGVANLFNITDTAHNSGTGVLVNIATGDASFINPFQVSASDGDFPAIAVDSAGKVGIGWATPTSQLTVLGGATFGASYVTDSLTDGNVAIENSLGIGTTAPTRGKLEILQSANTNVGGLAVTNIATTGNARLWVDASNNVRLDSLATATGNILLNGAGAGYVGIGTTNPTAKLEIGGTAGTDGIKFPDGNLQTTAANGTTYANSDGRAGDYYCKQKTVSASGQISAWANINTSEICGFNKRCESGNCIVTDFVCGVSQVADADNNSYNTTLVNDQCWMATNIMTTKYPDGTSITRGPTTSGGLWNGTDRGFYAYPPNATNNAEETLLNITNGNLGFVYQWSAAMKSSTTPEAQGICPTGWHIPTDAQQYALENYLKDNGATCDAARINTADCTGAGTKMKSGTPPGLNFPLAGYRNTDGSFYYRTTYAYVWSSSESGASSAWYRFLSSGYATVLRYTDAKAYGFSVRCLKD